MDLTRTAELCAVLGHPARLGVLRLLAGPATELRAGEIAEALALRPGTLSPHLAALSRAGLVAQRRAGRAVMYRRVPGAIGDLVTAVSDAAGCDAADQGTVDQSAGDRLAAPLRVLFVCADNAALSIFAEAILRDMARGRLQVVSAAASPRRRLHPLTLAVLSEHGHDLAGLATTSLQEAAANGPFDMAVTLGRSEPERGEPGLAIQIDAAASAYWPMPEPETAALSARVPQDAFAAGYDTLFPRLRLLTGLPLARLTPNERQAALGALALPVARPAGD